MALEARRQIVHHQPHARLPQQVPVRHHPDIRLHGYTPAPMGKREVRGFYVVGFFEAFPGVQLEFDESVSPGLATDAAAAGRVGRPALGRESARRRELIRTRQPD